MTPFQRFEPRVHAALLLSSIAACGLFGCGPEDAPAEALIQRPVIQSLASYRIDGQEAVATGRKPLVSRLQIAGERLPTLSQKNDFGISIRQEHLRGASVRGRYGLLGEGSETEAVFRIRVSAWGMSTYRPLPATSAIGMSRTVEFAEEVVDLDSVSRGRRKYKHQYITATGRWRRWT